MYSMLYLDIMLNKTDIDRKVFRHIDRKAVTRIVKVLEPS